MSARDLVHWAVMQRAGAERIITADTDFDRLPIMVRLDPVDVGEWGTGNGSNRSGGRLDLLPRHFTELKCRT